MAPFPLSVLRSKTGQVWGFRLLHGGAAICPGRTLDSGSGEICVESHIVRDCAHYTWAPGDACSYLPIMPKISKDGGESVGPKQVELPEPLAGRCGGGG